jgi:3-hydroxy-9,10-secoandrosta-1,3,5(10)-triene-9,17-dione monooxygenase
MAANLRRDRNVSSSAPTLGELAEAADRLAPLVRANAEEAERRRDPVPELVAAMREAGLHRLYMPRRFGGFGMDWGAHFVVGERLSRECGSTGWIASLVFSHILYVGRFAPEGQEEFFAASPDAVLATGSAGGGALVREGEGWRLKGRWSFVSGVNIANGVMIVARENGQGPISHFILLLPGEYIVHDTWHAEGLRGTGSHDVTASDVFVPARRVLSMQEFTSMTPPGAAIAESYVHCVRTPPYQKSWFFGPLLGTARGALASYLEQTRARTGRILGESIVTQVPVQVRIGAACAKLDAAELIFADMLRRLHELGAARAEVRGEELLRMRRLITLGAQLCAESTDVLATMMGITGFATGNPVQRLHRDCRTVSMHVELNWDHSMSATGKVRLGVPTGDPLVDSATATSSNSAATLGTQL